MYVKTCDLSILGLGYIAASVIQGYRGDVKTHRIISFDSDSELNKFLQTTGLNELCNNDDILVITENNRFQNKSHIFDAALIPELIFNALFDSAHGRATLNSAHSKKKQGISLTIIEAKAVVLYIVYSAMCKYCSLYELIDIECGHSPKLGEYLQLFKNTINHHATTET